MRWRVSELVLGSRSPEVLMHFIVVVVVVVKPNRQKKNHTDSVGPCR